MKDTGMMPAVAVERSVSPPVAASIPNTEMLLAMAFVTYAKRPWESIVMEFGPLSVAARGLRAVKAQLV